MRRTKQEKVARTYRLPTGTINRIDQYVSDQGITYTAAVTILLNHALDILAPNTTEGDDE